MSVALLQLMVGCMFGILFMGVGIAIIEVRHVRRVKRLAPIRPDHLHDVAAQLRDVASTLDGLAYDERDMALAGRPVPGPTGGTTGSPVGGARATA